MADMKVMALQNNPTQKESNGPYFDHKSQWSPQLFSTCGEYAANGLVEYTPYEYDECHFFEFHL